jgi:superoxide reductase
VLIRLVILKCKDCDELYDVFWHGKCGEGECHECACAGTEAAKIQTADWKTEKHVPVIEKTDGGIKVIVGSTPHPMEEAHHITMIQVEAGNKQYRQYLKPGQKPEAFFPLSGENIKAIEHCNIHGLWSN